LAALILEGTRPKLPASDSASFSFDLSKTDLSKTLGVYPTLKKQSSEGFDARARGIVYGLSRAKRTIHISAPSPFSTLGRLSLLAGSRTGSLYPCSPHVVRASHDLLRPKYRFLLVRCRTLSLVMQSHFQIFFARKKQLDRSVSPVLRMCRSPISPACKPESSDMVTACPPDETHVRTLEHS